ncbi:MAG: hypothetical protein QM652_04775 [Legionella sp.]|uniref:hypothetical protein n=1 Tax=Legionella sp. TaxID=459 RepID=UPI0039E4D1D3
MRQFAYALTIYRVCLSIYSLYAGTLDNKYLQTAEEKLLLSNQKDVISTLTKAKEIEQKIDKLLESVGSNFHSFKEEISEQKKSLIKLFEFSATHLQECAQQFPDNRKVFRFFMSTNWYNLLTKIFRHLYPDQYPINNFNINPELISRLKKEMDQCLKIASLKIKFLENAYKITHEIIVKIKIDIAQQKINATSSLSLALLSSKIPPSYNALAIVNQTSGIKLKPNKSSPFPPFSALITDYYVDKFFQHHTQLRQRGTEPAAINIGLRKG